MTPLALPSKIRIKLMDQKKQFDGLVLKPNDELVELRLRVNFQL